MSTTHALRTRIAVAGAVAAVYGCASLPPTHSPIAPVGGFFAITADAAIVVGRTFFDIIGWGIVVTPASPAVPPATLLPD
jgi:hypothetical protein